MIIVVLFTGVQKIAARMDISYNFDLNNEPEEFMFDLNNHADSKEYFIDLNYHLNSQMNHDNVHRSISIVCLFACLFE